MGWCLDLLIPDIEKIFGKTKYEITKPDALRHYVYFNYEGEITLEKKRKLVSLFPEDVYVIFYPDSVSKVEETPSGIEFPQGKPASKIKPVAATVEKPVPASSFKINFPGSAV